MFGMEKNPVDERIYIDLSEINPIASLSGSIIDGQAIVKSLINMLFYMIPDTKSGICLIFKVTDRK